MKRFLNNPEAFTPPTKKSMEQSGKCTDEARARLLEVFMNKLNDIEMSLAHLKL